MALLFKRIIKPLLKFRISRNYLNYCYTNLSPSQKNRFHYLFAKIYRYSKYYTFDGSWKINILDKKLVVPIVKKDI